MENELVEQVHNLLLIYISILGALFYFNQRTSKRKNRVFVFFAFGAVFLVQALRGASVGLDTHTYMWVFESVSRGSLEWTTYYNWEPLFVLLNRLVGRLTDNPQVFIAVCSAIILTGIGYFIAANTSEDRSAFWPVFFFMTLNSYFNTMNLLREEIAIAITMNIYTVLIKNRNTKAFVKALILLVVGISFHRMAVLCLLLLVPFMVRYVSRKMIVAEGIVTAVIIAAFPFALRLFFHLYPKYEEYYSGHEFLEGVRLGGYYIILTGMKLIMFAWVFFMSPKLKENRRIYILSFIVGLSTGILLLQTRSSLAVRLSYFFEMFMILLVPEFVERTKMTPRVKAFVYILLYLFGWIYFIRFQHLGTMGSRGCVPYVFFWN